MNTKWRKWRLAAISLITAAMLAAVGCSHEAKPDEGENIQATDPSNVVEPDKNDEGKAVKDEQKELLEQFQLTVSEATDIECIVIFMDENMSRASYETADEMLSSYQAIVERNLDVAQQNFFDDHVQEVLLQQSWPITADTILATKDEAVKLLVQNAFNSGYKLELVEATIYPVVDYSFLKKFSSFLSDSMNAYLAVMALESDQTTAKDGALVITWDELAERALAAEGFLRQYPDSPEYEAVRSVFDRYLSLYLAALPLPNTPVYDRSSCKLLDEVKSSYERTAANSPDTVTAQLAVQFLNVLAQTNGHVCELQNGEEAALPTVEEFWDRIGEESRKLL